MDKIFVSIEDCLPGLRTADKIYNKYWAVVVNENTVLDEETIYKLRQLGIESIRVYDEHDQQVHINSREFFKVNYDNNIKAVKNVLHDIMNGKKLDVDKINQIGDSICDKKIEKRNIIDCLNQVRNTDEYTYTHSLNVSLITMLIAKWLKFDDTKTSIAVQAGLLHDIGKSQISDDILNKAGPLNEEEFAEIKKHPLYGYRIASEIGEIDKSVLLGILMHHEREDGSGYPLSAKGSQIHEFAKIIAVADIYDAMTSARIYKDKQSPFEVFRHMEEQSFGVLDQRVVRAFLSNIAAYYIGDNVELNNGSIGEIVHINPRSVSKPVIRVNDMFFDLLREPQIKIVSIV
jgi:uncharacterized domain HDIG